MILFFCILLFIIGLALIIIGGDILVKNSIKICKITGIPQILIGATILSLATTLPELCVTVFSSVGNLQSIAIGNAIGSVIFNLTFILGICLFFAPHKINRNSVTKNFLTLFFTIILIWIFALYNQLNKIFAIILLIIFICYFILNIIDANRRVLIENIRIEKVEEKVFKKLIPVTICFIFGASLITTGAKLLVDNGERIAQFFNVSEHVIGVVFIAIGTSLPELVTAISSIRLKSTNLAIGNTFGANILATTLLLGTSAMMSSDNLIFNPNITYFAIPIILIAMLITYIPIYKKNQTFRWQGLGLLILFLIYYISVFING